MNEQDMREVVIGALTEVAPDVDTAAIDAERDLAEQLDIDSMDFLNIVVLIHERTGIEIPERDYPNCRRSATRSPTSPRRKSKAPARSRAATSE